MATIHTLINAHRYARTSNPTYYIRNFRVFLSLMRQPSLSPTRHPHA